MKISLIGMSGTGKSYWSKKLEKSGFIRFSVDEMIEKKLQKKFPSLKINGISSIAKWMGHPFEPQYKSANMAYLELEEESMRDIFSAIESPENSDKKIVIDTTGSLIYLNPRTLKTLTRLSKAVYFKVSKDDYRKQLDIYISDPKPVIWGNKFKIKKGESNTQALAHCYPALLKYRTEKYEKIADITLDVSQLKDPSYTIKEFITQINLSKQN